MADNGIRSSQGPPNSLAGHDRNLKFYFIVRVLGNIWKIVSKGLHYVTYFFERVIVATVWIMNYCNSGEKNGAGEETYLGLEYILNTFFWLH
jgi:hypothetical protein